jgi:beta-1,4-N-acetylglucosaminyltransferase
MCSIGIGDLDPKGKFCPPTIPSSLTAVQFFGLSHSKVIYVESFARVKSLSLSAKLLKPFVDTFVVQWPQAGPETEAGSPAETGHVKYKGWLV